MTEARTRDGVLRRLAATSTVQKLEIALELLRGGSELQELQALAMLRVAYRDLVALHELRVAIPNDRQALRELDERCGGA
jgi:hypothetical protein